MASLLPGHYIHVTSNTNNYAGGTVINSGTANILNTTGSAFGSGAVTVNTPAVLGGKGILTGPVSGNGRLRPGDLTFGSADRGTLRLNGGLDLSSGGTFIWDLGALSEASPGVNFDLITSNAGNLALGGTSKLTLNFPGIVNPNTNDAFWTTSHTWKIIDLSGTATNTGTTIFGSITNATYTFGSFSIQDPSLNGGDIVLAYTPVPEPSWYLSASVLTLLGCIVIRSRQVR